MATTKLSSFRDITFDDIAQAVDEVICCNYVNFAPLGKSSETLVLCGLNGNERREGVSFRKHSGDVCMLICDSEGGFVAHVKFDPRVGRDRIQANFFRIFESVKPFIHIEEEFE